MHPENQRWIARALVRLVNAGVDVVAPTHSSTIVHQVSNMILASRVDDAARAKLAFTKADHSAFWSPRKTWPSLCLSGKRMAFTSVKFPSLLSLESRRRS